MERREFLGGAAPTTITANISNSSTSISILDSATFPAGNNYPFAVTLSRGTPDEEKVLVSSRSGNTLSVAQRGYDGTTARAHANGSTVYHVMDAVSLNDMNQTTYDNEILIWMGV
jgi:hypothetical protein